MRFKDNASKKVSINCTLRVRREINYNDRFVVYADIECPKYNVEGSTVIFNSKAWNSNIFEDVIDALDYTIDNELDKKVIEYVKFIIGSNNMNKKIDDYLEKIDGSKFIIISNKKCLNK